VPNLQVLRVEPYPVVDEPPALRVEAHVGPVTRSAVSQNDPNASEAVKDNEKLESHFEENLNVLNFVLDTA